MRYLLMGLALCLGTFAAVFTGCDVETLTELPVATEARDFDGLSQACFDSVVRIRNREGTGCGNGTAYLRDGEPVETASEATHVEIETNRHVALDRGADQIVDVWFEGDLVASERTKTNQSWFDARKSKDIATIIVSLEQLGGPLAVIPPMPYGETLSEGDKIFTVGCSDGRHPRARCANVLSLRNGLIYYDPKSIGGDSGGPVYKFSIDRQRWERVGRTAWAIKEDGRWVGLAMDQNRVDDIRAGRVNAGNWDLPQGAVALTDIPPAVALPCGAIRLDELGGSNECDESRNTTGADPVPMQCETGRPGWVFPVKPDSDRRKGPIRRIIGGGIFGIFSYIFWTSGLLLVGAIYIGPMLLTTLKFDWPIWAVWSVIKLIIGAFRKSTPVVLVLIFSSIGLAQCENGQCEKPVGTSTELQPVEILPDLKPPVEPVAEPEFFQPMEFQSVLVEQLPPSYVWPSPPIYEFQPTAPTPDAGQSFESQPRRRMRFRLLRRLFRRK